MPIDIRLLPAIATTCGIFVTISLFLLNQRRKELSFEVLRREALLSVKGPAKRKIDVRYNGEPVPDAHLVVVKVSNSGHLPITPADYQARLSITVSGGSRILMADVTETCPADLDDRFRDAGGSGGLIETVDKERVVLRPVLLNASDAITVQMLVRHMSGNVRLNGHVLGISKIKQQRKRDWLPQIMWHMGALIMAGAMFLVEPSYLFPLQFENVLPYVLLFLLGYVFLVAGTSLPSQRARYADWEI